MSAAIKSYYQDVKTFTDEELESLSAEMRDAFEHNDGDGGYWSDDEAETRHSEMQAELRRRHPREPSILDNALYAYVREAMLSVGKSLELDARIAAHVGSSDLTIGDTVAIRRPYRFTS